MADPFVLAGTHRGHGRQLFAVAGSYRWLRIMTYPGVSAIRAISASDSPISARAVSPKGCTPRDIKFVFRNFRYPASALPGTLKTIAQELEARGVRTPAGLDRWDAKQVSRLLAA